MEVIIRDISGSKIEQRAANMSDEHEIERIFNWLNKKYGLSLNIKLIDKKAVLASEESDGEFLKF